MAGNTTAAAAGTIDIGGDLTVNRMGYGAMRITGPGIWGEPADREQAKAALRRALELDVNFIDTADSYGPEVSETLIAETLYPYPDGLVIATKGGFLRPGPGRWEPDGRPEHLREACEGSLRRLRLEQIDLYQFHVLDPKVPLADSIGALAELKAEGKIRHIGVSNLSAEQIGEAQAIVPVVSAQNRYNVNDRSAEPVLDLSTQENLAFLPWAPISRSHWPGCWPGPRRSCRSRGLARPSTWQTTSPPRVWSSPARSSTRSPTPSRPAANHES
jgi:pyridoxine 4-dehydrogenase